MGAENRCFSKYPKSVIALQFTVTKVIKVLNQLRHRTKTGQTWKLFTLNEAKSLLGKNVKKYLTVTDTERLPKLKQFVFEKDHESIA